MTQRSIITACAEAVKTEGLYLFCSYHPELYTIWEVLRASTAAPTYFAPVRLSSSEGIEVVYRDSGPFGLTNPSIKAYDSISNEDGEVPKIIISLGSGVFPHPRSPPGRGPAMSFNVLSRVRRKGFDEEAALAAMANREGRTYYSRFNVQEGLGVMALDEWKGKHGMDTLRFIREQTERYLSLDHVKKDITEAARRLVEARRARASTDHWGRYCHGVEYVCTVISCKDNTHGDRADLRRHLVDVHQIDSSRIETMLDRGKRFLF